MTAEQSCHHPTKVGSTLTEKNNGTMTGGSRPSYGEADGAQGHGTKLTEEESAEIQQQSKEMAEEVRRLDRTMLRIPVTIAACRLGLHAWANWCVIMLWGVAMVASSQDINSLPDTESLSPLVCKGMDMLHDTYGF